LFLAERELKKERIADKKCKVVQGDHKVLADFQTWDQKNGIGGK
jgi:hypothetical protein